MTCLLLLSFIHLLIISIYHYTDCKKFVPNLNAVHVRDLNFVLRSEIFVHFDGQLQAFHLILSCTPVYISYQPARQALTVGSPLLSYIDIRNRDFFSPRLTIGEAQDLDPRLIRVGSLVPASDGSANTVFQGRAVHTVEEQRTKAPVAEQVEVELVDSSSVEAKNAKDEMVVRRTMTADRFLLGGRPAA